jgi:hypothetical protein
VEVIFGGTYNSDLRNLYGFTSVKIVVFLTFCGEFEGVISDLRLPNLMGDILTFEDVAVDVSELD